MPRFLLDTNIISEPFKLEPNPAVIAKLQATGEKNAIASVTWHELLYGFHRMPLSRRKRQLETYLFEVVRPNLPILSYEEHAAQWFALQRARLAAAGKLPAYADGQIAAIATVNNLILVTRNINDYREFTDLEVENWFR